MQIINSYHSRLKKFLNRFSGISTKYLSGYLYLFAWKERNKEREPSEAYKELLAVLAEPNNYLSVDDIIKEGHLPDAIEISNNYRKKNYVPTERDKEIYRRFASGETMTSIAASYGITKQAISLIIQSWRKHGLAYPTEKDKRKQYVRKETPQGHIPIGALRNMIRAYEIYEAKQYWTGDAETFNRTMMEKYGISKSLVKNSTSVIKRMLKLKKEIFIFEDVSFLSQEQVYRNIYTEYQNLRIQNPERSHTSCMETIAAEYGFTTQNIDRILKIMTTVVPEEHFAKKRRLTKNETYNRDKALFIEYLKWPGERKDFCRYAAEKYGITYSYATTILRYCLYADPRRYNMV